jgi:hypothetical protein
MIFWALTILVAWLIVKVITENDREYIVKGVITAIVIMVVPITLILDNVTSKPYYYKDMYSNLQKQYTVLSKNKHIIDDYYMYLFNHDSMVKQAFKDPNVRKELSFFDKVKRYNKSVKFWREHPNYDILIWGIPGLGNKIAKLPLFMQ